MNLRCDCGRQVVVDGLHLDLVCVRCPGGCFSVAGNKKFRKALWVAVASHVAYRKRLGRADQAELAAFNQELTRRLR